MNNEFTMSLASNFGLTPDKVGITTTVKQQVQHIELTIDHFKKCIDTQRKQQSEIDNQLINLQKQTETNLKSMLNQISLHSKQLIQSFSLGSLKENKQIEYLQLQRKIVQEQQQKVTQLSTALNQRVTEMQENVGL